MCLSTTWESSCVFVVKTVKYYTILYCTFSIISDDAEWSNGYKLRVKSLCLQAFVMLLKSFIFEFVHHLISLLSAIQEIVPLTCLFMNVYHKHKRQLQESEFHGHKRVLWT